MSLTLAVPGLEPQQVAVDADDYTRTRGQQLGPVGGRIFAEVVIGLVAIDSNSYLSADPCWTPADVTKLTDLLRLAGEL